MSYGNDDYERGAERARKSAQVEKGLENYVDVAERIRRFYEAHPNGRLTAVDHAAPYEFVNVAGEWGVIYRAYAYRDPDDPLPGLGVAWEPFPGRTPYTRGSELQNAETSAWGRAIVATGLLASDEGVASRQEVAARKDEAPDVTDVGPVKLELLKMVADGAGVPTGLKVSEIPQDVRDLAGAIWSEAGLDGAKRITAPQRDALLELARTKVDPFPVDRPNDDEGDDDEGGDPPADDPPPLPPDAQDAVDELRNNGPAVSGEGLAYELGLDKRVPYGIAQGVAPFLATNDVPADDRDNVIAGLEELIPRLDELKLREYITSGLWALVGGDEIPTRKAPARDLIAAGLHHHLDALRALAAVAAEFSE